MKKRAKPKGKVRRTFAESAEATDSMKPIFGGQVSNVIPGELIIQLREDVASQISESIPRGPRRGTAIGTSSLGVSALDNALAALDVTSITRLHPGASPVNEAMELAVPMAATFRVTFASTTEVETAVAKLDSLAEVEFAEPNRYRETCLIPNDPSFPAQWGLTRINCPGAWDRTIGSPNVVVAVIDTGIDLDHPELAPLLVPGQDMVDLGPNPIPPPGFRFEGDFAGRDNDPQDEVGHGTHVAGTIACLSNNATGVAGVTWNCRLMPVRVLARIVNIANPADVRGTGSAADIAAGIRWAVDHGARVLNLSLGGTVDTQVERDAIAYAIAHGAVVVAAMGNAFMQGNPTSFPAAYPDVVAVGAISQADTRAPFSQTGPHIDIAAPGVGILSTVWDNGFTTMQGTSMATPHVSGVAALILSCNASLTGAQVADILRQTARPLRDNPADPIPNNNYGFGCVDAQAALNRACPRPSRVVICRSKITVCPSMRVVSCPPPSRVLVCPSFVTVCPSLTIAGCPPSRTILTCPPRSRLIVCPSVATICPSRPSSTCPQPSISLRCPSGPVCGINPPEPRERISGAGGDPYAAYGRDVYGTNEEDWEAYDPYGMWYDEEEEY